jgi:ABC-type polysaccharide/polyol phosphate export permease
METQTILSTIGVIALVANALLLLAICIVGILLFNFLRKTKQDAQAAIQTGQRIINQTTRRVSVVAAVGKIIQAVRRKSGKDTTV